MDQVFVDLHLALGLGARMCFQTLCISISLSINLEQGANRKRKRERGRGRQKGKKQPCITMDRSLEQCNAASESFKIREANNF